MMGDGAADAILGGGGGSEDIKRLMLERGYLKRIVAIITVNHSLSALNLRYVLFC